MWRDRLAALWLLVTAGVCGAVVMDVELLGARLLSPGYGASQVVWAVMISVTLLSLTVGYFVGGFLADRRPRPGLLYGILLVAAALLAACPHVLPMVLRACRTALGIKGGALVSSLAVFFLPLSLLGVTSPFVIRLISERGRGVGTTAGGVYAISTIGSVAGTLAAGLYLIEAYGAPVGLQIAAVVGGATAAVGLVTALGWRYGLAVVLPVALACVPAPGLRAGDRYLAPNKQMTEVKDVRDSLYGHIVVLEQGDHRLLVVNGIVQTGVAKRVQRLGKAEHLLDPYFQELLPYTMREAPAKNALLIGVAGGLTATILRKHGLAVECVDLDPEMFEVARRWFFFEGEGIVADGRQFLEEAAGREARYDFCVIDTYSGDCFPFYMASVEAFRAARAVLKRDGVLAINFIGSPTGRPFACVHKTLGQVFPHVLALQGESSDDVQTITLFASDREIDFQNDWLGDLGDFTGEDEVWDLIDELTVTPERDDGIVLTDAHNPIDFMRSDEAVRWRERTATERIGERALF